MKAMQCVMSIVYFLFFLAVMVGCGQTPVSLNSVTGATGASGPAGAAGTVTTVTNTVNVVTVGAMVAEQNAYRNIVGQVPLEQGLDCNLYTVPTTTTGITATANGGTAPVLTSYAAFFYTGVFNQPNLPVTAGFNVLPMALQPLIQTWFIMKCTGTLFVADNNYHSFALSSDDGSNLYINGGTALINNDGLHAAATVTAEKLLTWGMYSFELDFMQGSGQQELILNEDGKLFDTSALYH